MKLNKKGLSPLIAAVLLIVVVIGIGYVVTGIIKNFLEKEVPSPIKCNYELEFCWDSSQPSCFIVGNDSCVAFAAINGYMPKFGKYKGFDCNFKAPPRFINTTICDLPSPNISSNANLNTHVINIG